MSESVTNQQALMNVYAASRLSPLNADQHAAVHASAVQVENALKELEGLKSRSTEAKANKSKP